MLILYILLVSYILAINFYAFLLIKSLRDKEKQAELETKMQTVTSPANANSVSANQAESSSKPTPKPFGKLLITGILGGAIAIYISMFIFKYKRSELLLMVLMPLLGVLNIYFWVLLFRSGFSFFLIR